MRKAPEQIDMFIDEQDFIARQFITEACSSCSADGVRALKILSDLFEKQTIADPSRDSSYAYYKEGQRSVIKYIQSCINNKENA